MFSYTIMTPTPIQGHLHLMRDPAWYGLGRYTDFHGVQWDVRGVIGDYIQAAPVNQLHPYLVDTSNTVHHHFAQRWLPYTYGVMSGRKRK